MGKRKKKVPVASEEPKEKEKTPDPPVEPQTEGAMEPGGGGSSGGGASGEYGT